MFKFFFPFLLVLLFFSSCNTAQKRNTLFIPDNIVIAHRGTTYWAPEETEAAYIWARNIGAHYLEVDIQRSKDGVLMALHDNQLKRTTDISNVFPKKDSLPSSAFNYDELLQLDAGSWFNKNYPERANKAYSAQAEIIKTNDKAVFFSNESIPVESDIEEVYIGGLQQILSLEDVLRIAEGYRIAKDSSGKRLFTKIRETNKTQYRFYYVKDQSDADHRPGVYIETKEPHLFPGVESDLFRDLDRFGWNQCTKSSTDTLMVKNGKVNTAFTSAKVILQTFSPESLKALHEQFKGEIPITFLLWLGDPNMPDDQHSTYQSNLDFAKSNGAHIIGPSIAGPPNNYSDLLKDEHYQWIRNAGFKIHPYSFDTKSQTRTYGPKSDGMFTNRADITLDYYSNK